MAVSSQTSDICDRYRLAGRTVLVTGGGRGFGRELALAFVRAGANVAVTAHRSRDELDATVAMAETLARGRTLGVIADAASQKDCDALVDTIGTRFGAVDILVNNAARGPIDAMPSYDIGKPLPFWSADAQRYAEVVQTNVVGPFLLARAFAPGMVERGFGRIINISTSRPTMIRRGAGPYGATKAALEASTRVWADDLDGTGVTVNALLPGAASDTALIPGGDVGTRAAADFRPGHGPRGDLGRISGLLPADILVPPALWLSSRFSDGFTGRRLIAKDWDPHIDPAKALLAAADEASTMPNIL
ncbi:SDR family NAD(P)-dependent oxidoreductase [Croceicoccus mobilis]|uniref:Short-chain dehydrogenase n=1 Tax=Croceicoccus mobilis TaxID=1703339 RepID=A0A916Z7W9_9SPHN|nr:SDR family oxidoreductase [Croceicoccus mobilis]GGD79398.1 hypothetical protein GCM10010990_31630 [Croceicoccus mobilis]